MKEKTENNNNTEFDRCQLANNNVFVQKQARKCAERDQAHKQAFNVSLTMVQTQRYFVWNRMFNFN